MEAKAFCCTLAIATVIGTIINFLPVDPVKALYWSTVINGMMVAPIMALMMLLASSQGSWGSSRFPYRSRPLGGLRPLSWG